MELFTPEGNVLYMDNHPNPRDPIGASAPNVISLAYLPKDGC